jgi:hypothetical protein
MPRSWETYLQTATLQDLEELEATLPNSDAGNYRRVCLAVERSRFQIALTLLEEGGSFFNKNNFGAGLHGYVRQRLGLKLKFARPIEGDALAKEDTVYWYLAWCLHHAEQKAWEEAGHCLEGATSLAKQLGMQHMLSLLKQVLANLTKPYCGLAVVAPPHEVLASPKAFDTLRQQESTFGRLAALQNHGYLGKLERCRLAQYHLYRREHDAALRLVESASPRDFLLAYALRMKLLECLERFEDLATMVAKFKPGSSEPLQAEATMLGYESCAFYFAIVRKEYPSAYAYLHRAEALAIEHDLTYRLSVIHTLLENVSNMAGDNLVLDPLLARDGLLKQRSIRNRFDSFLRAGNLAGVEALVNSSDLAKEELFLARASHEYQGFITGTGKIHVVAGLITNQEPHYPVSRFYWSLLLLQVFSHIGAGEGRAEPSRICKILVQAVEDIVQVESVIPVAAQLYPLGLALAAHLHPRLEMAVNKVATVWCRDKHDGLRLGNKKISIITKPVREAIVLDDLYSVHDHLSQVLSTKATPNPKRGHRENKVRFERSLEQVQLKRHEITSVGGLYRGLLRLGKSLGNASLLERSSLLKDTTPFLQHHLRLHSLEF